MSYTENRFYEKIFIEADFDNDEVTQCCQNIYNYIYANLHSMTADTRLELHYFIFPGNEFCTLKTLNTALVRLSSHCGIGLFNQFFYLVDVPQNKYRELDFSELQNMVINENYQNLITLEKLNKYEFDCTYKTYFNLRPESLLAMRGF